MTMQKPLDSDRLRQRGIVLPVVLVMLLLMTITVLFLMRRGTVDERIAFNVREVVSLDSAAQYALRTCERHLWCSPPGFTPGADCPPPPNVLAACGPGDARAHCIARCADNADQPHCRPGCDTNPSQTFCTPRNMAGGTPAPAWRNTAFNNDWQQLGATTAEVQDLFGANVVAARCLFEDATHEVEIVSSSPSGPAGSLANVPAAAWRKYRITAEVEGRDATVGRAQAEVRLAVGP
jgi:Tfp pilus assembly protein PilX